MLYRSRPAPSFFTDMFIFCDAYGSASTSDCTPEEARKMMDFYASDDYRHPDRHKICYGLMLARVDGQTGEIVSLEPEPIAADVPPLPALLQWLRAISGVSRDDGGNDAQMTATALLIQSAFQKFPRHE